MSGSSTVRAGLKMAGKLAGAFGKSAVEVVFPSKCLACGEFIDAASEISEPFIAKAQESRDGLLRHLEAFVCRNCLIGTQPALSPVCEACGLVFTTREGADHTCESCLRAPNHFQQARSALVYTDTCAHLVRAFKYNGKTQLARPLGMLLRRAFHRFWAADDFDLIVPIPLHQRKLKQRGFNQVWLMMRQWALVDRAMPEKGASEAFEWGVMERVLPTIPQTGLGRKERTVNLRNAFGLPTGTDVTGLRLLVVDDVYTTGATANECARMLRKHGAERVDVLTLARAV